MKKHMYRAVSVQQICAKDLDSRAAEGPLTIGCDAAKRDWRAAVMDSARRVLAVISFAMPDELEMVLRFFSELRELGRPVEIAAEVTGTYSEPFADAVRAAGFPIYSMNVTHVSNYSLIYDGVPSSHDSKAACVIAALHMERPGREWRVWSDEERKLSVHARMHDVLRRDIEKERNRLEALLALHWPELTEQLPLDRASLRQLVIEFGSAAAVAQEPERAARELRKYGRGALKKSKIARIIEDAMSSSGRPPLADEVELMQWLARRLHASETERKAVEEKLEQCLDRLEVSAALTALLGKNTTAMLYASGGDPTHFPNARSLLKYFGLNLKERSSGKHKGALKITKRGSSRARQWLFLAALRLMIQCPVAKAWVHHKAAQSGSKMKAVIALMRKLVTALPHLAQGKAYDAQKLFDVDRLKRLKKLPASHQVSTAA